MDIYYQPIHVIRNELFEIFGHSQACKTLYTECRLSGNVAIVAYIGLNRGTTQATTAFTNRAVPTSLHENFITA